MTYRLDRQVRLGREFRSYNEEMKISVEMVKELRVETGAGVMEAKRALEESGGDFEKYLMAKSKEAMSSYEIERKEYAETVSTYSDIYTGILIAAPLFFVAALTLVSMLGGQIGGINVSVIIGFGTYLVIPFLNIAFIVFLNISQPEV